MKQKMETERTCCCCGSCNKEWRRYHCRHQNMTSSSSSRTTSSSLPLPLLAKIVFIAIVLLSLAHLDVVNAQEEVGVSVCACQPATIDFQFQLDLTCDDRTISEDTVAGLADSACITNTPQMTGGGSNDTEEEQQSDTTPVMIDTMQILELDQKQQVVSQTVYDDGYTNGDIISFASIVVQDPTQVDSMTLPSGLAVTITGRNAAGQQLLNSWAVRYTNSCDIYPVLEPGMQIGWTVLARTEGPPPQYGFCPADDTSTMPPATEPPVEETTPPTPATPEVTEAPAPPTPAEPDAPTGIPTYPPVVPGSSSKPQAKRKKKSQDSMMMSDISKSSRSKSSHSSKRAVMMKKSSSSSSKSRTKSKKLQRRKWEDRLLGVGQRPPTTPYSTSSSPAPKAFPER